MFRTPGARRRIIAAAFGLSFVVVLMLAIGGVFSKEPVAPGDPNTVGGGLDEDIGSSDGEVR